MHCGTSLLQRILARHPSIYCERKELKFIEYLPEIKRRFPILSDYSQKHEFALFCASVIKYSVRLSKSLDDIPIANVELSVPDSSDHLTIFFDVFNQLGTGHQYWLEGSPNSVFYYREIRKRLPNAKFIVIVRDVRDVLASKKTRQSTIIKRQGRPDTLNRKKLEKDFSPVLDSLSWKSTYTICKHLEQHDPHTFTLRYEDLTFNPSKVLMSLCAFLDVPYLEQLLDVSFSNRADGSKSDKGIYQNTGNYRKTLSPSEVSIAQTINKKLLRHYTYQVDRISVFYKIASISQWLKLAFHLIKRLWKRYRLLGQQHFWAFLQFSLAKLGRGILGSRMQHR